VIDTPLIRHPASVRRRMPPSPRGGKALSEPRQAARPIPRPLLPIACCLLPDRQIPISSEGWTVAGKIWKLRKIMLYFWQALCYYISAGRMP